MQVLYPEFIPSLENTKYPFLPTATLNNGTVFFLEGTFLDAHIYAVVGTSNYYISAITVTSSYVDIVLGDINSSSLLKGTVSLPVTDSVIQLVDNYNRPAGLLVTEPTRLAIFTTWGVGTHVFERSQTEFAVTCQMPIPDAGVTGFLLPDGSVVTGNVWFVGEDGVVVRHEQTEDKNGDTVNLIRVDVVGDPLFLQKLCNPESLFVPVNAIRKIHVIADNQSFDCEPNEYGDIAIQMNDSLATDAALRIRTTDVGLVISVEGSATKE